MYVLRKNVQAAFTLIEILIAMFIFLVGILGVLAMFPAAIHLASQSIGEARANVLAKSALAQLTADCRVPYETGEADGSSPAADRLTRKIPASENRKDYYVTLTAGPGKGQSRLIANDNGTILTVSPDWTAVGAWTAPGNDADDAYVITRMGLPDPPLPGAYREFGLNRDLVIRAFDGNYSFYAGMPTGKTGETTVKTFISDSGTASGGANAAGAANAYIEDTDSGKAWDDDQFIDYYVRIVGGAGEGQVRLVVDNTNNRLYVSEDWDELPDDTSEYEVGWASDSIWHGAIISGTAEQGQPNWLQDDDANGGAGWTVGEHRGRYVRLTGGPGAGQGGIIKNNEAYKLIIHQHFDPAPDNGTAYEILAARGYVLITSGRASGRLLPIVWNERDAANGYHIVCGDADFTKYGVKAAERGAQYLLQDAASFTIVGNSSPLQTVLPVASAAPPLAVNTFDTLGASDRIANDEFGSDAEYVSEYSYVAIFSDSGTLADGPVRVDVLVYRNFDRVKELAENLKPVGFLTGYIGRPQ